MACVQFDCNKELLKKHFARGGIDAILVSKTGIEGKSILMSGKIFRDTISVDRLKHYAEDAKKSIEEIESITQPEYKINMIAEAVAIRED